MHQVSIEHRLLLGIQPLFRLGSHPQLLPLFQPLFLYIHTTQPPYQTQRTWRGVLAASFSGSLPGARLTWQSPTLSIRLG